MLWLVEPVVNVGGCEPEKDMAEHKGNKVLFELDNGRFGVDHEEKIPDDHGQDAVAKTDKYAPRRSNSTYTGLPERQVAYDV